MERGREAERGEPAVAINRRSECGIAGRGVATVSSGALRGGGSAHDRRGAGL